MTAPGWAMTVDDRDEGRHEPDNLAEAVQQTVGGASVCWDDEGVFRSEEALALSAQLIDWVERHYYKRAVPLPLTGEVPQGGRRMIKDKPAGG